MKLVLSRNERIAVVLFALARTLLCAYRAATQSITVDEASTYMDFVRGGWPTIWGRYDPNDHVLYSVLARLSTDLFHPGDFSLRLPSVLAGFFFVIGLYLVLALTVESRAIRWVTLVGVSIAPLLLDFFVAARGYGLGITLLVWAIFFSIRRRDLAAGVFAGLALATTLNLAYAVVGLAVVPLLLGKGRLRARLRGVNRVAEAAAVVFIVLWFPLFSQLNTSHFYVGERTYRAAIFNLIGLTIRVIPAHDGFYGGEKGILFIQHFVLPLLMLFIVAVAVRAFLKKKEPPRELAPVLVLLTALAGIYAAHRILGMNYPVDRLGLYVFVLLAIAWAIAASRANKWQFRALNGVLAIALIAQFLTQFETHFFTLWVFDASINHAAQKLRDEVRGRAPNSVSLSCTWYHTPALQYYREIYHIDALKPVERHDPTQLTGFDYYIVEDDTDKIGTSPLRDEKPLYKDDFSKVELLK